MLFGSPTPRSVTSQLGCLAVAKGILPSRWEVMLGVMNSVVAALKA